MGFQLLRKKKRLKKIYNIIKKEIPSSVFKKLGFEYFDQLVKEKFIHVYIIKVKRKIASIITVVDFEHYKLLSKKTILYLIKNPLLLFQNLFKFIKSSSKNLDINLNRDHLHLLHLVILGENFKGMSLKKKDKVFDVFYKKIVKNHKSKYIFLCLEKNNAKALRYYKRNKFYFFYKIKNLIYLKKNFN